MKKRNTYQRILLLSIMFVVMTTVADLFDIRVTIATVDMPRVAYPVNSAQIPVNESCILYNDSTTVVINAQPQSRLKQAHIGFLKVHKAGSTTMQNMFFRFGLKHNLTIIIPKNGNYLMSRGAAVVPKGRFKHYDIFACHTVYSKGLYDDLLPADSAKIGIIREPFDRMVSAAYYYRDVWGVSYLKKVPRADFIHNIVKHPEKYDSSTFSRTRNSMGKDFGFSGRISITDKDKLASYLDTLNKEFSLIMVTEHFEESLVLMRRLLNWSIADIVYIKTNSYSHNPTLLSDTELFKFKQTSFLDYAIYDYFLKIFQQKVKDAGNDLIKEVEFLKTVLCRVRTFCNDIMGASTLPIEGSMWDSAFVVTRGDCKWMTTKELPFIGKLRKMYTSGNPIQYEK